LGAGGMGEVYLAQDRTLERNVALKILPSELVQSEERVRRFVREAKSASSLNHPNIVTIYEIGQDAATSVHFISMELVSGETLTTKIHHEKTDLRTLLGYLAQAAEGLAKAHAAGIVHRDLKPGNIMVSKDGFAKVLDFGLAKLTEREATEADATMGSSEMSDPTSEGAVVGTAGYMSPEQVRGTAVDHRSDIFSFGCILYEAATRKRPFVAESTVEAMHKILHEKPAPIEDLNKNVPGELRRLIRRCLAKNPDQRLQSAKDLAIELREIVDEYETLSPSSGSGSLASGVTGAAVAGQKKGIQPAVLLAGATIIAALVVVGVVVLKRGGGSGAHDTAPTLRISAIPSPGTAEGSAISPDGRYLAYSRIVDGLRTLWVRQVATGSDVQILGPQRFPLDGLVFNPGGDYLYYQADDPEHDGYRAVFEVPALGGTPRKVVYDVDSRITFSPDGKQFAFRRGEPHLNRDALVIRDLESGKERNLATAVNPYAFLHAAWSPDGKRIAVTQAQGGVSRPVSVVTVRLADGRRESLGKASFVDMSDLTWLPDGSGLIVSAFDPSTFTGGQLWRIGYPDGRLTRITSDANEYDQLTVSADGNTIAAVRTRKQPDLWVASATGSRDLKQITFGSGEEGGVREFTPGPDNTIFYESIRDGKLQIFSIQADGSGDRSITQSPWVSFSPNYRPGTGVVHHRVEKDSTVHIWRMDANGENARQLTSGHGETISDISRDGHTILFYRDDSRDVLRSVSSEGGEPANLGVSSFRTAFFSRDGNRIMHTFFREVAGRGVFSTQIISAKGGGPASPVPLPPRSGGRAWTPDGKGATYVDAADDRRNLFLLPLDGSPPRRLTDFKEGRILGHLWSPDGKHIGIVRRVGNADNIWITAADGSNAFAITDFESGTITGALWSLDGSRSFFTYGQTGQNVVLIRDFRRRS
jgi:Tol biopolymer transport system component